MQCHAPAPANMFRNPPALPVFRTPCGRANTTSTQSRAIDTIASDEVNPSPVCAQRVDAAPTGTSSRAGQERAHGRRELVALRQLSATTTELADDMHAATARRTSDRTPALPPSFSRRGF